jgi:hypothetical protein
MLYTQPDLIAAVDIPTTAGASTRIELLSSTSILLLGANGAGKTRLGVFLEDTLGGRAHRIGAHRSLEMTTDAEPKTLQLALGDLRGETGNRTKSKRRPSLSEQRRKNRWQGEPATSLLFDFHELVVALYSEQADVAVEYLNAPREAARPKPKIQRLAEIWHQLLPHRKLVTKGVSSLTVDVEGATYDARELSDGERVIFYLIGHVLLAPQASAIIVDEPELHINRAIIQALWDVLESERRDCCFVYVTHDLEMAASRRGAIRYVVEGYRHDLGQWDIELIPVNIELPEDLVAKIVGSRVPILFVEGTRGSLDSLVYRHVYSGFTVHGAGSCDDVIRTVRSFNRHSFLHRVGCAGLVDADDRDVEALTFLRKRNIHVLPVAEIENLLLLPGPFLELARLVLRLNPTDARQRLDELKRRVFVKAKADLDTVAIEATRRKVDALLKRVELSKLSADAMRASYQQGIAPIDPMTMYNRRLAEIDSAIQTKKYEKILALYANKGLLSEAAAVLGQRRDALEGLLGRLLGAEDGKPLLAAVRAALPAETSLLAPLRTVKSHA